MKIPKLTEIEAIVLEKMPVNVWVTFGIEIWGTDPESYELLPEDVVKKTMLSLVSKWAVEKASNGTLFRRREQSEIIKIFTK